jgi:hypothetical protein
MSADRDLERFVETPIAEGKRRVVVDPRRVVLTVAVVLAVAWVCVPTFDELRFHFSTAAPTDVGDAMNVMHGADLPIDSYVRTHVVLGNRAATIPSYRAGSLRFGPIQVRQVLGSPLFIEFSEAAHKGYGPFVDTVVEGRVRPFDKGGELDDVRTYLERTGLDVPPDARVLVVDEKPGTMQLYVYVWTVGLALVLWSVAGLLRSLRPRVIEAEPAADSASQS